ncbi:hypothetical protein [Streptodolium elevatio]|uniref:Uncharacterized protein n=1 Tax=Streptodolium elevatio TaxID=3157996 RepID=A0ABV3DHD4_9ACTN
MTDPHQDGREKLTGMTAYNGLKLHRRTLRLDGRSYTVLGLRPGTAERFAVNEFHGTWHVVTHRAGALLLGSLLWGMAHQRAQNTVLVVDRPFLDTNPFDAEPSPPIVIAPAHLAPFGDRAARELRRRLPLSTPSEGTVRLRTSGYAEALADTQAWFRNRPPRHFHGYDERHRRPVIGVRAGLLVLPGTAEWLREWAVEIGPLDPARPGAASGLGMVYDCIHTDFSLEVQVFDNYHDRVTAARLAREQLESDPAAPKDPDSLHPLVWDRGTTIHTRMRRNRTARQPRSAPRTTP